jgi:opacity protein-like surface antigen
MEKHMKRLLTTAATLALATTPAFAAGLSEPAVEVAPAAPAAPVATTRDWTGFYLGAQGTLIDGTISDPIGPLFEFDGAMYGLHAGYLYDFGRFVAGAEVDMDFGDIDVNAVGGGPIGVTLDSVARLKLKGGYDLGNALIYGTAGWATANTSPSAAVGDTDGYFYGIGATFGVTQNITATGEILRHEFDGFDLAPTLDTEATTFSLRVSYNF